MEIVDDKEVFDKELTYKINIILRQTNYTENEAIEKLNLFNNDTILVIKNYLGIQNKNITPPLKSINQEIYKQIRIKLDSSIVEYNKKRSQEEEVVKLN